MNRVLVTGAAGFIGSTLCERLSEDSTVEVIGIDSFTDYYSHDIKRDNVGSFRERGIRLVEADLAETRLDELLEGVDTIFHLAGQPGVRPSWGRSFDAYVGRNIQATQTLLEACRDSSSLQRVVYASSSSVYGSAPRYPTLETDMPQPLSPYGVTKLAAEHLMVLYAENFGVPTVSLRYFTVYGPRQRPDMGFTRFITRALERKPLVVYGDGSQVRDFTFVADIVEANIAAATHAESAAGRVYNISGGTSVSLRDALETLANVLDMEVSYEFGDSVAGDVKQTGGDSARARHELNWAPRTDLRHGLSAQVEWLRPRRETYASILGLV